MVFFANGSFERQKNVIDDGSQFVSSCIHETLPKVALLMGLRKKPSKLVSPFLVSADGPLSKENATFIPDHLLELDHYSMYKKCVQGKPLIQDS